MKMRAYSVYDAGVEAYMQPFFARADGEAKRSFVQACAGQHKDFSTMPEYYTLFCLGDFDDSSGMLTALKAPVPLLSAQEAKALGAADASPGRS